MLLHLALVHVMILDQDLTFNKLIKIYFFKKNFKKKLLLNQDKEDRKQVKIQRFLKLKLQHHSLNINEQAMQPIFLIVF